MYFDNGKLLPEVDVDVAADLRVSGFEISISPENKFKDF